MFSAFSFFCQKSSRILSMTLGKTNSVMPPQSPALKVGHRTSRLRYSVEEKSVMDEVGNMDVLALICLVLNVDIRCVRLGVVLRTGGAHDRRSVLFGFGVVCI